MTMLDTMRAFLCLVAMVLLFSLLLALDARAGWSARCPGQTSDPDTGYITLAAGGRACLRQTTATDPARIDASACRGGLDLFFQDPTGTNYDASALVYQCAGGPGTPGTFTDCKVVPVDRDGDGAGDGLPLTGAEASLQSSLHDLSPGWYAFDVTNGSSRTIELQAICR